MKFVEVLPFPSDSMELSGADVVVIDVLRATSSMVVAMANGCKGIIPTPSLEEAKAIAYRLKDGFVLAGERDGFRPEGFDLGNSPLEFSKEAVGGRFVVLSTTNGTRALLSAAEARNVLICSFLNLDAVAEKCMEMGDEIFVLCSGSKGRISIEDLGCAGALIERISGMTDLWTSDSAKVSLCVYRGYDRDAYRIFMESSHGRYLLDIGFGDDLSFCAKEGIFDLVPVFSEGMVKRS
jgi:2-phosphosulfolactate phosphatase